jgi:hypothetical protein
MHEPPIDVKQEETKNVGRNIRDFDRTGLAPPPAGTIQLE